MKLFFVLLAFLIGLLLRSEETLFNNFLFLLDQGRDMMAVKSILYDHHLTLIGPNTSLQGVFQGPLWYYLIAIPTFLMGGNPWGGVILMLIMSLSVMGITFYCMKRFFGWEAAIVSLFLVAIAPESIAAATFAWNPHPMWLLLCIFIFSFYRLRGGNKKMNFVVWPIITLMFHFETALAVFILATAFIDLVIFDRKILKNRFFILGFLLSLIFFLPQILFDIKHNFLMTHSVLNVFSGHGQGLLAGGEHKTSIATIFQTHLKIFSINFDGGFFHESFLNSIQHFFFLFPFILLLLSRIKKIFSENEQSFLFMLYELVLIVFILTLFYPFPLRSWFLTGFQIFFIYIVGISLSKLLKYPIGIIVLSILFLLNIFLLAPKIYKLYAHPDYGGIAKINGKLDAIKFIYKDAGNRPLNLLVFNPPVYTDAYDYLIFWYGKTTNRPIPQKEKKGTFYLLMEPDSAKPWSYKGWIETVIKTGNVVFTKTLASGLIVEKRTQE